MLKYITIFIVATMLLPTIVKFSVFTSCMVEANSNKDWCSCMVDNAPKTTDIDFATKIKIVQSTDWKFSYTKAFLHHCIDGRLLFQYQRSWYTNHYSFNYVSVVHKPPISAFAFC